MTRYRPLKCTVGETAWLKCIFLLLSLSFVNSCTNRKQVKSTLTTKEGVITAPKITLLEDLPDSTKPRIRILDSLPKPKMVVIPTKRSYLNPNPKGGNDSKNLEPPTISLLPFLVDDKGVAIKDSTGNSFLLGEGGSSNFSSFTTDNGLALDAVNCSIMDKMGNLWFGTNGGGVSRYDGGAFLTFSTAQGLANNMVVSIMEDREGNLWFGTGGGGVSRYDGKSLTTFSTINGLANNVVYSIAEDNMGNLWFGTRGGGVSCYNGKTFSTFTTAQGLANNEVFGILKDKTGKLWFATAGGVSRYDGKSFINFSVANGLAANTVKSIAEDKMGNLWFGTLGGGVSRYNGKSFTTFSTRQGLANNAVFNIAEDNAGNIWFATEGGVSCFNGNSFSTFSTGQGLANKKVECITEDKAGNLWFGTIGGGLSRYQGKAFTTFSTAHGLAHNSVGCITEDKSGNLWFGTIGGGASRFDGKSFTNFSTTQGLANKTVACIAKDRRGNLWFGTYGGGVSRYNGTSFTTFSAPQGLGDVNVTCILEDRIGNIWFGTYGGGVSRYDGTSFTNFETTQGLASNTVFAIAIDKKGNLWFGTDGGGVSRYDGKSFTTFTTDQGLASNAVFSIMQDDKGNLWFGTSEGLSVMTSAEATRFDSFLEVVKRRGKNNDIAQHSRYPGAHMFKSFTKTDGLPDNFVTQVLQMPNGEMIIGTNIGIAQFFISKDFKQLNDLEVYNSGTNCPVKDVNAGQNGMYLDRKGIIWAGTGSEKHALVRFDPSALRKNKDKPKLVIKSVKVNEEDICWNDLSQSNKEIKDAPSIKNYRDTVNVVGNKVQDNIAEEVVTTGKILTENERNVMKNKFDEIEFDGIARFYPSPEHLILPYRNNRITINFNAIETSSPSLVNYQYMLEGYEDDWSPVSKGKSATFGNIHEGTYHFKVKAQSPNGVWCEPISYTFKVLPPWYRTPLGYFLYIVLIAFSFVVFIKRRERKLRQANERLERTVTERTEELTEKTEELEEKNLIITKLVNEQEKIIELRTIELAETNKKLEHVNQKLLELIRYNAHNLREPLARVIGAMDIKDYITSEEFEIEIWPLMRKATMDLDNSIREVVAIADETVKSHNSKFRNVLEGDIDPPTASPSL